MLSPQLTLPLVGFFIYLFIYLPGLENDSVDLLVGGLHNWTTDSGNSLGFLYALQELISMTFTDTGPNTGSL